MVGERWRRQGHEDEASFDWLRAARDRGVPADRARALHDDATRRAALYPRQLRARDLFLAWLDAEAADRQPLDPGKRTRATAPGGRRRIAGLDDLAVAPGKRTLTMRAAGDGWPRLPFEHPPIEPGKRMRSAQLQPPPAAATVFRDTADRGAAAAAVEVPASVAAALAQAGEPLDDETRRFFERRFGTGLGHVRVVRGAGAAASAREIGARAYAAGSTIVLGDGPALDSAAGRRLLAHELAHVVHHGAAGATPGTIAPQDDPREAEADALASRALAGEPVAAPSSAPSTAVHRDGPWLEPLEIRATTFQGAAQELAHLVAPASPDAPHRIVVVNGPTVRVFDNRGNPAGSGRAYRLLVPTSLPIGVFTTARESGASLRYVLTDGEGTYSLGEAVAGRLDFRCHLDDQAGFDADVDDGRIMYVSPTAALEAAPGPPAPPPEVQPELARFVPTGAADLAAWPSAVVPLTPQVTSVGSTGSFLCHLEKDLGYTLLDRTTNLMQPMSFCWQVLRLDASMQVTDRQDATRWGAAVDGFRRRERQLQDDRRVWLGEHPERQSAVQRMLRAELADSVTDQRRALAITGQIALTVIHALAGGTSSPNVDDIIDVPFAAPGEYFVRCLATPVQDESAPHRRATSVAGVMVSVFDAAQLADAATGTEQADHDAWEQREEVHAASLDELRSQLAAIDASTAEGRNGALALRMHIRLLELSLDHDQAMQAASDELERKRADLAWTRARIAYLTGPDAPRQPAAVRRWIEQQLRSSREQEREQVALLGRVGGRLGSDVTATAVMPATLIEEETGAQQPLTFSIGERTYLNNDELEVVIADITQERGRVFSGRAPGQDGSGRELAWSTALHELRRNLGRGRGWLALRLPATYAALPQHQPNPMQLQLAPLDQAHEMVDDAVHAATLLALLAAPFTGGASLAVLAVAAPIAAGSSLYRLVNRAAFEDLHVDVESVGDFVNIASLGLGRVGAAGPFASRGVQMVAGSSRLAVRLLDGGQYVILAWSTYQELMKEVPGESEPQRRARILRALLGVLEQAGIAGASHVWPAAHGEPGQPDAAQPHSDLPPAHPDVPVPHGPTRPAAPEIEAALGGYRGQIEIRVVENMENAIHVEYDPDFRGGISEVRVWVGPGARPADVAMHVPTIRAMLRYRGFAGQVRTLLRQLAGWLVDRPAPPVGSRAWEAEHELVKLRDLVGDRVRRLRAAGPHERDGLLAELDSLRAQLRRHGATLNAMDLDPGVGYVAMARTRPAEPLPDGWQDQLAELRRRIAEPSHEAARAEVEYQTGRAGRDDEVLYRALGNYRRAGHDGADLGDLDQLLATLATAGTQRVSRAAGAAPPGISPRVSETVTSLEDSGFLDRVPRLRADLARGDTEAVRGKIAVELATRGEVPGGSLEARFPPAQGYRIEHGLQIAEVMRRSDGTPYRTMEELRRETGDNGHANAARDRRGFEWDGLLWRDVGDLDISVTRQGDDGRAEFVHVEEIKAGQNDRPERTRQELDRMVAAVRRVGDGSTRLVRRNPLADVSADFRPESLTREMSATRGPHDRSRPGREGAQASFDESVGLTQQQLTQVAEELVRRHRPAASGDGGAP
jgi:hypothetical protein